MADCEGVGLLRNFCFHKFAKILILCFVKFSSNFAKLKIILSKFRETQNFDKIILIFAKFEESFAEYENFAKLQKRSFAATLCRTGVRGGEAGQYAYCTLFGFPLYRFPFCHL